jgi:hypothetical protein
MTISAQDHVDLADLRLARFSAQVAVEDAANAAREVMQTAGFSVALDDRHAALDASVWRYLRDSNPGLK